MARMRTLKPEFFRDKKIQQLSPTAALVFQALWCMADDGGVAPADPERVYGEMFIGWAKIGLKETTLALTQLYGSGRVVLFRVGDDQYAEIPSFARHQQPKNPSKFRYPRPEQEVTGNTTPALPQPYPSPTYQLSVNQSSGDQSSGNQVSGNQSSDTPPVPDLFAEAWAAYPPRPGHSKAGAQRAWTARLKEGHDPQTLLAGIRAYARYTQGSDPQFIKHAATFLGPDRHWEADWTPRPPPNKAQAQQDENRAAIEEGIRRVQARQEGAAV